ncbi:MAG: hypothetical protein ACK5HP_01150 [Bacilli bacterium]
MTKIIINNKLIEIDLSKLTVLSKKPTYEGIVYEYNNTALKIFHKNRFNNEFDIQLLDEFGFLKLKKLQPYINRFVLSLELVYDEEFNFIAYTTKLIKNEQNIKSFESKNIGDVINAANKIREDELLLTENNIRLVDLNHNYIYNGNINIIDPGMYKINQNSYMNLNELLIDNLKAINNFLISLLIFRPINEFEEFHKNKIIENFINKYCKDIYFGDYLKEEVMHSGFETIEEFIKTQKTKMLKNN